MRQKVRMGCVLTTLSGNEVESETSFLQMTLVACFRLFQTSNCGLSFHQILMNYSFLLLRGKPAKAFLFLHPHPTPANLRGGGVYQNSSVRLSIYPSVLFARPIMLAQCLLNRTTIKKIFFFFTKLGMVVYYHEMMCHVRKIVHYLQCQGHSEDLYN